MSIKRYLLTSAQNNTLVHVPFWRNLLVLAKHYDAEILVGTITYIRNDLNQKAAKVGSKVVAEGVWFAPEVSRLICDKRKRLAPSLEWCGEVNISPTAERPLSGFESYTGRASSIFPHPRIAMESIPAPAGEPTKFIYTTGSCTVANYIQRKAGLKAEFHHSIGCLVAETDGVSWWVRQVIADRTGTIQDLKVVVKDGKITKDNNVLAISWGDIHVEEMDNSAAQIAFGEHGMLDTLKPEVQFLHDVFSFTARSHHDDKRPLRRFELHASKAESVRDSAVAVANFLSWSRRPWCRSVVVNSNHDRMLDRWLDEADYRKDPVNAEIFLTMQLARYRAAAERVNSFNATAHLITKAIPLWDTNRIEFLNEDEGFVILKTGSDPGIECGVHSDRGPNGAKGARQAFTKLGRRMNVGHSHSAGITDGVYQGGTMSRLRLPYNKGPSSWSHSQIVTYPNGKRAIIHFWKGKWHA